MPKMFIYGSCLTRDTKNFFPDTWKASTYIARQSLISAASGQVEVTGESKLKSAFQNRMIEFDLQGSAFREIDESLEAHDLFLIDLVDERRGVFEISPDKYVTRSYEMINSGLIKQQTIKPRWIDFGTEEHFNLWCAAFDAMLDIVKSKRVPMMAVTPPWSATNNRGEKLTYKQGPVRAANVAYERYNSYVREKGIATASIGAEQAVAAANHQWGPATFHYIDDVYKKLSEQILDFYSKSTQDTA